MPPKRLEGHKQGEGKYRAGRTVGRVNVELSEPEGYAPKVLLRLWQHSLCAIEVLDFDEAEELIRQMQVIMAKRRKKEAEEDFSDIA